MRFVLLLVLLALGPARARAEAASAPPPSAALVLRVHPPAWHLPSHLVAVAGLTLPDESGATDTRGPSGTPRAAGIPQPVVRIAADGSRHVVLGGAIRAWVVVHEDGQGRLVEDCVHSADEAARRVRASAPATTPTSTGGH